jgi:hypothetical protein
MNKVLDILSKIIITIIWAIPSIASGTILFHLLQHPIKHSFMYFVVVFLSIWFLGWTYSGIAEAYKYLVKEKKKSNLKKTEKTEKTNTINDDLNYHKNQFYIAGIGSIALISFAIHDPKHFNILTIIFPLGFIYNLIKISILKSKTKS